MSDLEFIWKFSPTAKNNQKSIIINRKFIFMTDSQIIIEKFNSKALEGNPLGDPAVRRVGVYLPPDYVEGERYPVVYLLTAYAARGLKLLKDDLWTENIQERLDRLITSGAVRPLIAVLPDASTRLGGSQYLNSPATGNYEDHILELTGYIDDQYPTLAASNQRAVLGHSSGGYGALRLAMRHPEVFALTAAHSADMQFEMVYRPDFPKFLRYYDRFGVDGLRKLIADPGEMLRQGTSFYALAVTAMSSCYSPNPNSELGFDFPFDLYTGEILPGIWQQWLENDLIHMVKEYTENLRSLKLIFFDCGTRDEENLLYGARIFDRRLEELGIAHHYEEFDWGHRDIEFRYDVSLKAISKAFGG